MAAPTFAWVRRGWPGQVFGDEEFYCYRLDRRIYLMSCCVSLVTLTLFISSVAMLPAWIRWEIAIRGETMYEMMKVPSLGNISGALLMLAAWIRWTVAKEPFKTMWWASKDAFKFMWDKDPWLVVIAGAVLALALAVFFWLVGSIGRRMISGRGHFRWRIWAWLTLGVVVAMIAFVIRLDQDLALGAIAGMILVFALAAFFWLAGSIILWMIRGRPHFRGRIGVLMSLGVGAAMIVLSLWGCLKSFAVSRSRNGLLFPARDRTGQWRFRIAAGAVDRTGGVSVILRCAAAVESGRADAVPARASAAPGRRTAIPAFRSRKGEIIPGIECSGRPR